MSFRNYLEEKCEKDDRKMDFIDEYNRMIDSDVKAIIVKKEIELQDVDSIVYLMREFGINSRNALSILKRIAAVEQKFYEIEDLETIDDLIEKLGL